MIQLLDDTDHEVVDIVERKFLEVGISSISELEEIWLENEFPELNVRIEGILKKIQLQQLYLDVQNWMNSENPAAIDGWLLASRIQYPGLKIENIQKQLNQFKIDAWVMLSSVDNPIDKIAILNHVFFEKYGFKGNHQNYHSPDNSILPRVLETKLGNPISLAILYQTIAQDLGIPVFGVNLPQHFVVAYCKMKEENNGLQLYARSMLNVNEIDEVLFYFNPFSKGQVFHRESIDAFLKVIHIEQREHFYWPCNTIEIFKRILRNLHYSYSEQHEYQKQNEVLELMKFIGMIEDNDDDIFN